MQMIEQLQYLDQISYIEYHNHFWDKTRNYKLHYIHGILPLAYFHQATGS